jgi:serralysin
VARAIVNSTEFTSMYGEHPGNRSLVGNYYWNVLHREPDDAGYNYWVGLLDTKSVTASDVLVSFAESAENKAALVGVIEAGVAFIPYV